GGGASRRCRRSAHHRRGRSRAVYQAGPAQQTPATRGSHPAGDVRSTAKRRKLRRSAPVRASTCNWVSKAALLHEVRSEGPPLPRGIRTYILSAQLGHVPGQRLRTIEQDPLSWTRGPPTSTRCSCRDVRNALSESHNDFLPRSNSDHPR